jgi:hypothetical protein
MSRACHPINTVMRATPIKIGSRFLRMKDDKVVHMNVLPDRWLCKETKNEAKKSMIKPYHSTSLVTFAF